MTETLQLRSRALSRRSFLITVGGTGVAVAFGSLLSDASEVTEASAAEGSFRPNVWVTVAVDGVVTIISPASEMGQGVMTSIPLLIAEEMDADWSKVRIIQAPADAKNYGNPGFNGVQLTGSRSG
jgi:isoquinoline 1-oxidoreductase subunit beta